MSYICSRIPVQVQDIGGHPTRSMPPELVEHLMAHSQVVPPGEPTGGWSPIMELLPQLLQPPG